MITEAVKRIFKLDDVEIPDPDINMSIDQVRKFYSDQYPQMLTAKVGESVFDAEAKTLTYEFKESAGRFG